MKTKKTVIKIRPRRSFLSALGMFARTILMAIALATAATVGPAAGQLFLGLNAGPSYATIGGARVEASGEWGGYFAAELGLRATQAWGIAWTAAWQQKGAGNILIEDGPGPFAVQSSHLLTHVVVRRGFMLNRNVTVNPFIGMGATVIVGCFTKPAEQFAFDAECAETMPNADIGNIQWEVPAGLRLVRVFPGGSQFVTELRYALGLTDALSMAVSHTDAVHNTSWVLAVGFALPISQCTRC